jgi:hypothetical protein
MIRFDFRKDSYFTEAKENEIMTNRLNLVNSADPYLGKYFSKSYIQKNILRLTEEEVADINAQVEQDKQQDPNNSIPTQIATQVTTQQMTGDVQMQQQLQQQQAQMQMQAQMGGGEQTQSNKKQ